MLTTAESEWTDTKAAWISAAVAAGLAALTGAVVVPLLHRRSKDMFDADGNAIAPAAATPDAESGAKAIAGVGGPGAYPHNKLEGLVPGGVTGAESATAVLHRLSGSVRSPADAVMKQAWMMRALTKIKDTSTASIKADIHDQIEDDPLVAGIHARAENFAPQVENNFAYLQVFSAVAVIFAHGANEVGYMAGPLTTIWNVYQQGTLSKSVVAPIWIIALSASGLVVGLATYGHHVMRSMGASMAKLTPVSGWSEGEKGGGGGGEIVSAAAAACALPHPPPTTLLLVLPSHPNSLPLPEHRPAASAPSWRRRPSSWWPPSPACRPRPPSAWLAALSASACASR